ncbi:MAG: dienelactone hydrolase family protein [Phormidesmis sp.]
MIVTEPLVYESEIGCFEGSVSWDDAQTGQRPAVMIAPTFKGQSAFETEKAAAIAAMGYVGFAIDIYGQGKRASTPEAASQLMAVLNDDRARLLAHMQLALHAVRQLPQVDGAQIAAIGFCFGGKCVLDLARSGADIRAAVTFHGIYDPPLGPVPQTTSQTASQTASEIPAAVLVLHGWEDPLAPSADTMALADELTRRGADWQIHMYGHTGHAFTNPQAQSRESGMFFMPKASERGWQAMKAFLAETLVSER